MRNQLVIAIAVLLLLNTPSALADGKMFPLREYQGSLEETAQEAIIIFTSKGGEGMEDMFLKVSVSAAPESFGWVIPFPNPPEIEKADARLFKELFKYVERQLARRAKEKHRDSHGSASKAEDKAQGVEVLSRKTVGSYDTAVVREETPGALNAWLRHNGFQNLEGAADVVGYYRGLGYVFACVKVSNDTLKYKETADLHPLRFKFKTGGRDGIYFPMKMTGLQSKPFDVNLYVFYKSWLNDKLNRYGFEERGFALKYRDWDTKNCEANAGKSWDSPEEDPLLGPASNTISQVRGLFRESYPWERFYLTNIQAFGLEPGEVRRWSGDLWLFPYYTDPEMIPHDARPGGPANAIYQTPGDDVRDVQSEGAGGFSGALAKGKLQVTVVLALVLIVAAGIGVWLSRRRSRSKARGGEA